MGYVKEYNQHGKTFYIDNTGVFNEPRLSLSDEEIAAMNDSELLSICRWFAKNKTEISIIDMYDYGAHDLKEQVRYLAHNYQDAYIRARAQRVLDKHKPVPQPPKDYGSQWIYVIGNKREGKYKIGMTRRTPDERLADFSPQLPFSVKLVCAIETNNAPPLESKLHMTFSDKRINGEWFELDEQDIEYIKGLDNEQLSR